MSDLSFIEKNKQEKMLGMMESETYLTLRNPACDSGACCSRW